MSLNRRHLLALFGVASVAPPAPKAAVSMPKATETIRTGDILTFEGDPRRFVVRLPSDYVSVVE